MKDRKHLRIGDDVVTPGGLGVVADRRSFMQEREIRGPEWEARVRAIYGSGVQRRYQRILVDLDVVPCWYELHELDAGLRVGDYVVRYNPDTDLHDIVLGDRVVEEMYEPREAVEWARVLQQQNSGGEG